MQQKESKSNRHFIWSVLKSGVRIFAGIVLAASGFKLVGLLFIVAEILGIIEEF